MAKVDGGEAAGKRRLAEDHQRAAQTTSTTKVQIGSRAATRLASNHPRGLRPGHDTGTALEPTNYAQNSSEFNR